jgi:uncharacterized protein (TIGR03000 family)
MSVVSVMLLFWLSGTMSAQEAKASVRVINDTEDERTVEINKFPVRIKGKSEEIVVVPPGEFTYKVIGIDTVAQKRTVKLGDTWMMTIRASVTILPPDKEKELPPKVDRVDTKVDPKATGGGRPAFDRSKFARIVVKLPTEDTTVWVDGREMPAKKTLERNFITPDLGEYPKWQSWYYKISACWTDDKGNKRHVTQYAHFRCGDEVCIDFSKINFSPPPIYFGPVIGGCSR